MLTSLEIVKIIIFTSINGLAMLIPFFFTTEIPVSAIIWLSIFIFSTFLFLSSGHEPLANFSVMTFVGLPKGVAFFLLDSEPSLGLNFMFMVGLSMLSLSISGLCLSGTLYYWWAKNNGPPDQGGDQNQVSAANDQMGQNQNQISRAQFLVIAAFIGCSGSGYNMLSFWCLSRPNLWRFVGLGMTYVEMLVCCLISFLLVQMI